ncbi:cell wall-binding repeat-containing protein [Thermoactinomyces sp. CICC 10522]|uniref:cell wall-binding repeat-containing protein n=1 Tax=Thermoactinomyces sp. CICC 10522 TaxID=2767427 RepID=UPI0018DC4A2B|nr:cell wall-binding repeat-containing protein [Thermoactinomyces sp. CICC 10522]MBH8604116.1 cell wall-binding repeat-containing protein [Thermoactinomyces sp. CICC 10522]
MAGLKNRRGILLASGVAAAIAFSLPVCPSTWANPPVVKVMASDVRDQLQSDFNGKKQNIKMETEGKQAVLTVGQADDTAVYTSPVIKSKIVFTDVGIHWKNRSKNKDLGARNTKVEVRFSADGQKWSDWQVAEVSDDVGPHPNQEETFSDLIYAGNGRYLQYRVHLTGNKKVLPRIKDIKVTFINSRDGKKIVSKKPFWEILFDKVDAAVNKPDVVSRAEWGADESLRFKDGVETWPREYHPVTHLFVHHTDTPNDDPDPAARIRSIYYYHTVTRGWGDIGYNAIIGSDGRIYEGRKGKDDEVLSNGVVGAGTYAFNYGGFSVSLMGNYQDAPLPKNIRDSLVKLLAYEASINNINPVGKSDFVRDYPYNDPSVPKVDYNMPNIAGHRDSKYTPGTECPGDYVYNDLPNIRKDVKAAIDAASVNPNLKRLSGANRYEVSSNVSQELSALNISSDTVLLARGDLYTDALSGGPLAAKNKSPILLTTTDSLPTQVQLELQRRKPGKVIILGGTGSVSANVETQLHNLGITDVERIAGPNRFAVSASVADQVVDGGTQTKAFIASGLTFPDALSASGIAGQNGMPILQVLTDSIPDETKAFISEHPEINEYIIVGGPGTVSDNVKAQLEQMGKQVVRIGGANRFEVGVNLADYFNVKPSSIVFARGDSFPDALSGGPLAGLTQSPILLTMPNSLPTPVDNYLSAHQTVFQKGYILGGTASVSTTVEQKISSYMVNQ